MNKKSICIITMLLLLLLAVAISVENGEQFVNVIHQHKTGNLETKETGFDSKANLKTNLPLIIIQTKGQTIPGLVRNSEEEMYCDFAVIDNEARINSSKDRPTLKGRMEISIRGRSSRTFDKKQYSVKLVDQYNLPYDQPLLGMPAESTWVLNGSYIDHSQIRNYVLYNISAEIMGTSPRCRLCEVMFTDGYGNLSYQGMYTLCEKPKVSKKRLNLTPYDSKHKDASFLIHMNSPIEDIELSHLKPDNLNVFMCELVYPQKEELTEKTLDYIKNEFFKVEKVLYDADYTGNWSKVKEYIDLDSFVDYYIINEFFQNYDAGRRSTYLYKNLGGKFSIGPVWDFDGAFNNYEGVDFKISSLDCKTTFYYYYLVQNPDFVQKLEIRYLELRNSYLSDEYLIKYIDESYAYARGAILRNCEKWYQADYSIVEKDIESMKEFVRARGKWMDENFVNNSSLLKRGEKE